MISDPTKWLTTNRTVGYHFSYSEVAIFYIFISSDGSEHVEWQISRAYSGGGFSSGFVRPLRWLHNGQKAEFLDAMRYSYPRHFEWLLFHPEWL